MPRYQRRLEAAGRALDHRPRSLEEQARLLLLRAQHRFVADGNDLMAELLSAFLEHRPPRWECFAAGMEREEEACA